MQIAAAFVLTLLGLIFFGGALRALPIGTRRAPYLGPSTLFQVIIAFVVSLACLVGGAVLLSN